MAKKTEKPMTLNKKIIAVFLFVLSYALISIISVSRASIGKAIAEIPVLNLLLPLPNMFAKEFWYSPTSILYPIIGFFFIYFIVDWVNEFFETEMGLSPIFPAVFFAFSLIAFYTALFFFFAETARLSGQAANFNFWNELKDSAFYLFAIGGMFGWLTRFILEKIDL